MRYLFLIIMVMFNSCNKKETLSINQSKIQLQELKELVIKKGNIEAYEELETAYIDYPIGEFLPYAILMANKYNYSKAYFDVFEILIKIDGCSIDYDLECLDDQTRNLALTFLKRAINRGYKPASDLLLSFYDKDKYSPVEELYSNSKLIKKAKMNVRVVN